MFISSWPLSHVEIMHPVHEAGEIRDVLVQLFEPPGAHGVLAIFVKKETNRLVVIGTGKGIGKVRRMLSPVPYDPLPPDGPRIHVVYLEHADCQELAYRLIPLIGGRAELLGVEVTADPATNSLIVVADPSGYAALKSVIEKLDIAE